MKRAKTKNQTKRKRDSRAKRAPLLPARWPWMIVVLLALLGLALFAGNRGLGPSPAAQLESFRAEPLSRVRILAKPLARSPAATLRDVRTAYNLSSSGGRGTIAIVNAYHAPTIERDLAAFTKRLGIRSCTVASKCLEIHKMASKISTNRSWALETALDVQWAHAIAPTAKILLVEARSNSGTNLLKAVDYARSRGDVVAISLSWGGDEFSGEMAVDNHFSSSRATIFAASGDDGSGTIWPAVSPRVVSVGGTTLTTDNGTFVSERAWSGSGGGLSKYVPAPAYQQTYGIQMTDGKRSVPDVSYSADPATGFPVYDSFGYGGSRGWFTVGGTSAGAPQWAAIHARGRRVSLTRLYLAGRSGQYNTLFRDITSGTNGSCQVYCETAGGYDHVTGLGSPLTVNF